jgi:hypothetical protein
MYNMSSTPTIANTTFTSNSGSNGGGMYNETTASPTIINTTFTGNSATTGGGIYNGNTASPTITNTTFIGNSATTGGGMYNGASASPTITNTTMIGNTASTTGGGMYNSDAYPIIRNSILWSNGTSMVNFGSTPTVSYSIIQGGYAGCSNCPNGDGNANPFFVNAADPDGADNTHRTADDGLRLLVGSPAINAGDNSTIPSGVTTDITGAARIQNTTVDMGAYEGSVLVCPISTTLYVDQSISSSGPGTSWATALKSLDDALYIAHNCAGVTTINVAAGMYIPTKKPYNAGVEITTADARDVTYHLRNGVAMYGGFPNGGGTRDIAANPTILSGDFNHDDVITGSGSTLSITGNTENAYHVVLSVSDAATTVLDGFTVSGGNANVASSITVETQPIVRNSGGGMFNRFSSPTITNTTFTENSGYFSGGMYNNSASSPTITNTAFTGNSAVYGGAMNNSFSSDPTITSTTFTGNSASIGGGIYNSFSSNPIISNCIVAIPSYKAVTLAVVTALVQTVMLTPSL